MQTYRSVHEVGWLFDGDLFHHLWVAYHQKRSVPNVEPRVTIMRSKIYTSISTDGGVWVLGQDAQGVRSLICHDLPTGISILVAQVSEIKQLTLLRSN